MSGLAATASAERRTRRGDRFRLDVDLVCEPGISAVCGPSGSGKSSLLLALLGALPRVAGRVSLDGKVLLDTAAGVDLPVRERNIGMVFQDAPLFPHLDVARNVAFGIRGAAAARRAHELLERVGALDLAARHPSELSGGQAQRVALARALGSGPAALLLDEPFSALDPPARESLGDLLIELQRDAGIPFVHVTHDLGEALRLARHLVLIDGGRVVQSGPPARVIARPESLAAARSVGTENLLPGDVLRHLDDLGCTEVDLSGTTVLTTRLDLVPGARVNLGLRAEDVLVSLSPIRETSARNVIQGEVCEVNRRGPAIELRVTTPASIRVIVTPASVRELGLVPGREVFLLIKAAAFHRLL